MMIFLKKFKAIGFKSFANEINLSFNESMTGVVGPNGAGKSNIVDAIKWVLGEQSKKQLRGKTFLDIIFHGSKDRDGSNYALVSLTFDNSNKILHSDLDEIVVTRKISRNNGANEYYINNKICRLKDIQELFLDTGLAKGSLGIISQGTVQWFVEAKPEERRKIFEDAAGIGLYTKKKVDSLYELQKATINLNRVSDYVSVLQSDIKKLNKQVEKAKIYEEKKKQLTELELTILAKDISSYQNKLVNLKQIIKKNKQIISENETELDILTKQLTSVKEKANKSDLEVEQYNNKFANLIQEINKIEIQKNAFENQLKIDLSSTSLQKQLIALKQLITNIEFDLASTKDNKTKLENEMKSYEEIRNTQQTNNDNLITEINVLSNKINTLRYQLHYIDEKIENEFANETGVKAIIENKKALNGIIGTVKDFISINNEYEIAISLALGKSINYIVTEQENDAKQAINFLQKNKVGKATFLPLSLVKPKNINNEHILIAKQVEGFIDVASNLITYDAKYSDLFSMLLGRVLITNDLNSAIILSRYLKSIYQIVTIDGQTISVGGAITGGYNKKNFVSSFNLEENRKQILIQIDELNKKYTEKKIEQSKIANNLVETTNRINEKKVLINGYNEKLQNYEANLFKYKTDYEQLNISKSKSKNEVISVTDVNKKISDLQSKKDKVVQALNFARSTRLTNRQIADDCQAKLDEIRNLVNNAHIDLAKHEGDLEKTTALINNAKDRISTEYHMTVDYVIANWTKELPMSDAQARETIYQLKVDINQIGGINMEALKELEEKQAEFESLSKQHQQLADAKKSIEKIIAELDAKAISKFKETIDKVNAELPNVFNYLFGGGTAAVAYTNAEDILNSGIDVTAIPPGKKITTLNLLSGGEKTLVALSVLFAILKVHNFPLIILDEAESALDPANVERFANIVKKNTNKTQFIMITHRPGTMERCNCLFGATMQIKGITNMYKVTLSNAKSEFGSDNK